MNAASYLKKRQILWARRKGIALQGSGGRQGEKAYTRVFNDNFFQPISEDSRQDFKRGDGNEISRREGQSKIQAVHSSAALACNIFDYWRSNNELSHIARACKLPASKIDKINFEQKLKIKENLDRRKFPLDPNIDVLIKYLDSKMKAVAIECKFSEAYSTNAHSGLKEAYLKNLDLWNDIPGLRSLSIRICPKDNTFRYLHVAQLIKHVLGLKNAFGKHGFILLYLWYDVPFNEGFWHRQEIEKFAEAARQDNIAFQSLTYQEVILNLTEKNHQAHRAYIEYLTERYL